MTALVSEPAPNAFSLGALIICDGGVVISRSTGLAPSSREWFGIPVNVVLWRGLYGELVRAGVVRLVG